MTDEVNRPEDWVVKPVKEGWQPLRKNPKNHNELWPESARRWTVTVNLRSMPESLQKVVSADDEAAWEDCETWLKVMMPKQRWLASLEEGVEGNRHLQMIIVNDGISPVRQKQIVEHLGHPHYEPMKKGIAVNVAYASKATSAEKGRHLAGPWTNGDWDEILEENNPAEKLSKLEKLQRLILDINNPMVSRRMIRRDLELGVTAGLHRSAVAGWFEERALMIQEARHNQARTCLWVWGATKTGKSHDVELLKKLGYLGTVLRATSQQHPFDAYEDQNCIWLEEYRGRQPIETMLNVTDKWSDVNVDARYADRPLLHEIVLVTSNVPPSALYENEDPYTIDAWMRRWTQVFEKQGKDDHPLLRYFKVPEDQWPDAVNEIEDDYDPIPEEPEWLDAQEASVARDLEEYYSAHGDEDFI